MTLHEFDGSEGAIVYRVWLPDAPRRIVLLAHGYGEHSGRYEYVAARLTATDCAVFAPDHLGHGRSEGERALITDFEHVVDDLHEIRDRAIEKYPDLPTVLIGHSLGGLIAARYAQRYPDELAGLVLSGPVLGEWPEATDLLAQPEIPDEPIDPGSLSRDESVGTAYAADPLVYHGPFQQQMLRAIAGTMSVVNGGPKLGALPTLWLHGQADALVPLAGSTRGIEVLEPENLTTRIYQDARHEVFNETNRDEVLADTIEFIEAVTR